MARRFDPTILMKAVPYRAIGGKQCRACERYIITCDEAVRACAYEPHMWDDRDARWWAHVCGDCYRTWCSDADMDYKRHKTAADFVAVVDSVVTKRS